MLDEDLVTSVCCQKVLLFRFSQGPFSKMIFLEINFKLEIFIISLLLKEKQKHFKFKKHTEKKLTNNYFQNSHITLFRF